MKTIMLFLGKLILFSLLVIPTVEWFDKVYQGVLQWGVADIRDIPFMGSHMLYIFIVLVLATPNLGLMRMTTSIITGILLYLLIDRLMIPVWKVLPYTQKPGPVAAKEFYTNVYYMFMHWMLPFLLWLAFAFRRIEELFRGAATIE